MRFMASSASSCFCPSAVESVSSGWVSESTLMLSFRLSARGALSYMLLLVTW